jgi:orotidine-5'-phosphate decarboxylase
MTKKAQAGSPVFCALDTPDLAAARGLAHRLEGLVGGVKLGLEFFCVNGPEGVRAIVGEGLPVFLDLKLHDIPNTVAGAVAAAVRLGPAMLTVHAAGGRSMMERAVEAASEAAAAAGVPRPSIVGVTVLTSLSPAELRALGVTDQPADQVRRLAALAQSAGLDGVVCSGHEIADVRAECGRDFLLVVPAVRPSWAGADDQKRVTTPRQAIELGADILVVGRPITGAADPAAAARRIAGELTDA